MFRFCGEVMPVGECGRVCVAARAEFKVNED